MSSARPEPPLRFDPAQYGGRSKWLAHCGVKVACGLIIFIGLYALDAWLLQYLRAIPLAALCSAAPSLGGLCGNVSSSAPEIRGTAVSLGVAAVLLLVASRYRNQYVAAPFFILMLLGATVALVIDVTIQNFEIDIHSAIMIFEIVSFLILAALALSFLIQPSFHPKALFQIILLYGLTFVFRLATLLIVLESWPIFFDAMRLYTLYSVLILLNSAIAVFVLVCPLVCSHGRERDQSPTRLVWTS